MYQPRMYPNGCITDHSYALITLYTSTGITLASTYFWDTSSFTYLEYEYLQKGTYIVEITMVWDDNADPDYTVNLYAPTTKGYKIT